MDGAGPPFVSCAFVARNGQKERRPLAWRALEPDPSAVCLDDSLADGESQPGTPLVRRAPGMPVSVEHLRLLGDGDAGPRVRDGEDDASVACCSAERYAPSIRSEFHRISQEIAEDLHDARCVDVDGREIVRHFRHELDVPPGGLDLEHAPRLVDDRLRSLPAALEREPTRFDAGDVEQILNEPIHPLRGLDDGREQTLALPRVTDPIVTEGTRAHRDRADRISEIVRDDAEYLVASLGSAPRLAIQSRILESEGGVRRELLGEGAGLGAVRGSAVERQQGYRTERSLTDAERNDEHRTHVQTTPSR